jgi:SEC-C motif-containing protein
MKSTLCPCGSTLRFEQCCHVFISGQQLPLTALQLMKSRYSAFATANANYLNQTSIVQHPAKDLAAWAKSNDWQSLTILATSGGEATATKGTVKFKVMYWNAEKQLIAHVEESTFVKKNQQWLYDTGLVNVSIQTTS